MSAQRKRYLELADAATAPRSKLFYALMADVAPIVNGMARKNLNQHGAAAVYEAIVRTAASVVVELEFNLCQGGAVDTDRLAADFKLMAENCVRSQQVSGSAPVAPKMDA